ncbi:hypothetical protein QR685DRAFT_55284 [Neurospora intermedia]|uniref:Uncharacterized protein n=1 Tax=Neurospora intermedia TaxID=5142 RepID=A0ABR3DSL8_NEUIN
MTYTPSVRCCSNSINDMTREESSNMSAGQDTEESNGQATSPVMVSAALGDHFAQCKQNREFWMMDLGDPALCPSVSALS